jgi:hypothetical protein
MFNLSFDQFETLNKKNEGKRSGATGVKKQSFTGIKFSVNNKGREVFVVSNSMWDALNLDNQGFGVMKGKDATGKDAILFFVVADDNKKALFFKKTSKGDNKSKTVTSSVLKDHLVSVGLLKEVPVLGETAKPVHQYVGFEKVEISNVPNDILGVYMFTESQEVESEDESDDSTDGVIEEEAQTASQDVEVAQATPAPSNDADGWL